MSNVVINPQVCPTCGRCPTCGSQGNHYWQFPNYWAQPPVICSTEAPKTSGTITTDTTNKENT